MCQMQGSSLLRQKHVAIARPVELWNQKTKGC